MIRRFRALFIVLIVMVVASFLVKGIDAQTPNQAKIKSVPIELNIDAVYIPCEDPTDPLCVAFPASSEHPDASKIDHELLLTSGNLPPNTAMYITGCINTSSGTKCTTGSTELDTFLNSFPGGDTMAKEPRYEFQALNNPVLTDANGELSVIVRSYTAHVTTHIFNAYYLEDQTLGSTTIEFAPSITPKESLHLQTFMAIVPTEVPKPRPRPARVRNRDQDPKGRTFDIRSLEPVLGVEVTLLDSLKNLHRYKQIVNPQVVQKNGEFNFWVANGIYYLSFANLPPTHSWPVSMEVVHPNYSLAYYCDPDVKTPENGTVPLYFDQFSIIEYNKLVHCDVPLDPGTNTPYRSQVTTINYGLNRSSSDGQLNYSGQVSHPFTKIIFRGLASGKVVQEFEADKFGFWKLALPASSYPLTKEGLPDKIEVWYQKKDLTNQQYFTAIKGVIFEPLLRYLEGYAYDSNNQVIPYAKVGLKQLNADQVVYLASADKDGLFRIGSRYIPSFPYELVFTSSQKTTSVVQTSNFAARNKSYLQDKQLNLATEERENVPLSISSVVAFNSLRVNTQGSTDKFSKPEVVVNNSRSSSFILFVVLLIMGVVGVVLALKFLRKNKEPQAF